MNLADTYPTLLNELSQVGLDPDRLEPWAAWKVFKACLRRPILDGADAAYAAFGVDRQADGFWHVTLVRQLAIWEPRLPGRTPHPDDAGGAPEFNVVREVVIDLAFDQAPPSGRAVPEIASGDFSTPEDFVAAVESLPAFQDSMTMECIGSLVYEDEV